MNRVSRRFFARLSSGAPRAKYEYRYNHSAQFSAASLSFTAATIASLSFSTVALCDEAPNNVPMLATSPMLFQPEEAETEAAQESLWAYMLSKVQRSLSSLEKGARYLERVLTYIVLTAPLAGLVPANYFLGSRIPEVEEMTWGYLVWAIQTLGPCFIKLAQWASTRPDLFPPSLIKRIELFQDHVDVSYSTDVIEQTMAASLGDNWKSLMVLDVAHPIGTGSVAQVFKGFLKTAEASTEGIKIAVKMIHPHIEQLVKTDMELLNIFADIIDMVPSLEILTIGDTCREFADTMNQQLDLRVEASHLVKFAKKFAKETWAVFPQPVNDLVTKNVMVETLMEGTPISHFMNLPDELGAQVHRLKMKLSDLGCRLILKMVFFDNYIHGDLHPGNVLVQIMPNGEPRLVILDCGIVYSSKSDAEHQRLVDICLAFLQHDGRRAGQLLIDNAKEKKAVTNHDTEFCESIQAMIDATENQSYFEHLSEYVAEICELARRHVVRLDPGYFKIAMALKVAEGISLSLNRDLDLVSKCVPIVMKTRAMRKVGLQNFPLPEKDDEFMSTSPVTKVHSK